MKLETFDLERIQSLFENLVEYNLTESGLHPYHLKEILNEDELDEVINLRLGYGQTNGSIPLRQAIGRLYEETGADHVLVTGGSAEANFLSVWSHLEPGDELLLMLPNYMQIWGIARSFGVRVNTFSLQEKLNWGVDLDTLKDQVSPNTKMIAVCNPNNPTGAVLGDKEMQAIVDLAKKAGAWIYADEIYRGAELAGDEIPSFRDLYDKAVVTGGLSKAYGLPGLRLGWIAGPADFIEKAWSYRDYTTISSNLIGQAVAEKILHPNRRIKILQRGRKMLNSNLQILEKWVEKHQPNFHFVPPKAGGMVFIRYDMPINSRKLATKLKNDYGVFIMDGDCFGMDGYVRIGIGSETDYFTAGLERISQYLQENHI